jgi:hypothetical protein
MLRLHRVGIGMFAATFGLIAARLIRWRRGRSICQAHAKERLESSACDIVELRGRDERVDGSPR